MRMRMLMVMAVTGVVALCATRSASAEEVERDAFLCSERCDRGYEACLRRYTGKRHEDCPGALIRCRGECDPEWAAKARERAEPRSCRGRCLASFDACVRADDGKHGRPCAQEIIVCRNACPPEPAPATAPPPVEDGERTRSTHQPAPAPPEPETMPAASLDEHRTAPQAVAPPPRAAPPPAAAVLPEERPRPAGALPEDGLRPAAEPPAPEQTTPAHEPRPSVWASMWCAIGRCGAAETPPPSCDDACTEDYAACIARENPKRGGGCATAALRCRQGCARDSAAAP